MAFITLSREGQLVRRRRLLIAGTLGVGKTTALIEMLRYVRKTVPDATMAYLSFPGEKGYDSVPLEEPGLSGEYLRIWQDEDVKGLRSDKVVAAVEDELVRLLALRPTILAGDGFHKYFSYLIDAVTDGAYFDGADFEAKLYSRAYKIAEELLSKMMHSKVPLVALTTWTRPRPERNKKPGEKTDDIPQKIYPDLPPMLARTIVGEFSVAVVQTLRSAPTQNPEGMYFPHLVVKVPQKEKIRVWQTRPYGEVEGVTIKAPASVSRHIPTFIPASYAALDYIWGVAESQPVEAQ